MKPYDIPLFAVHVNGLWFAALICSLATGSFGMLVKQWLHEYLASNSMSPRRRLLERHFRQPGLDKWKVFEIAASLPILLHVSLGLFFLGLCFFTASVDAQLGHTNIVLVSGWVLFVVITCFFPLFSPRCPYKIPMLKTAFRGLRGMARPFIIHLTVAYAWIKESLHSRVSALRADMRAVQKIRLFTRTFSMITVRLAPRRVPQSMKKLAKHQPVLLDEDQQIDRRAAGTDLDVLLAVDAAIADDTLLAFMQDVLKRSPPSPDAVIDFVITLMRNRLGHELIPDSISSASPFPILDVSQLSHDAWIAVVNIIADLLSRGIPPSALKLSERKSLWPQASVWILLSQSQHATPEALLRALLLYMSDGVSPTTRMNLRGMHLLPFVQLQPEALRHLSRRFIDALHCTDPKSPSGISAVLTAYAAFLSPPDSPDLDQSNGFSLPHILRTQPDLTCCARAESVMYELWTFLHAFCRWRFQYQATAFSGGDADAFTSTWTLLRHDGVLCDPCSQPADGPALGQHPVASNITQLTRLRSCINDFISDDSMLALMDGAVVALHPAPGDIIPVVLKFLSHRLGNTFDPPIFSGPFAAPDLRPLSPRIYSHITSMLAETLQHHSKPSRQLCDLPAWAKGVIVILLSPSPAPLSDLSVSVLRSYISDTLTTVGTKSDYHCPEAEAALLPYFLERPTFVPISQHLIAAAAYGDERSARCPCVKSVLAIYHGILDNNFNLVWESFDLEASHASCKCWPSCPLRFRAPRGGEKTEMLVQPRDR